TELDEIKAERDAYKRFVHSIAIYAGNYPAWKAQSEFRELMISCEQHVPVIDETLDVPIQSYIDRYLGRIVDGLQELIYEQKLLSDFVPNEESWDPDSLEEVRGNEYIQTRK
ncbi:hypothetical protein P5E72_24060, partial [Vibrio parahaemolyticus]|nr:hypothetical protein [Vibrio parahaemolyticus]